MAEVDSFTAFGVGTFALYPILSRPGWNASTTRTTLPIRSGEAVYLRAGRTCMAPGDEALIETAFVRFLEADGWTVRRQVGGPDVEATRGNEVLRAEVKGRTGANTGLDLDTMYGQLLRRMQDDGATYAVVVPKEAGMAVRRVSRRIRDLLHIAVFKVDLETGNVAREDR